MDNSILVARTIVNDVDTDIVIRVLNLGEQPVKIESNKEICHLEEVSKTSTDTEHIEASDLLDDLCSRVDPSMKEDDKKQLKSILQRYKQVFSKGDMDMGRTDIIRHEIDTGSNRPIRRALRPQLLAMLSTIDEHLEKMQSQGIMKAISALSH